MSLSVAEAVRLADVPAIAINNTFRLAPWADMLYAADTEWWENTPDALKFAGLKVSVSGGIGPSVLGLRTTGTTGFDPDPECLRTGGNSGYQAVHIAAHAGADRILLCGFNMGGVHWHGPHQRPLRTTMASTYESWIDRFATLAKAFSDRGGPQVINCTPGTALHCWPKMDLETALARLVPAA